MTCTFSWCRCFEWYSTYRLRDRAVRVVLLWVNNHFEDFERSHSLMAFLESFEERLESDKLAGPLKLLRIACSTKARRRCCTLLRPRRSTNSATTAICVPSQYGHLHVTHCSGLVGATSGPPALAVGAVNTIPATSTTTNASTSADSPHPPGNPDTSAYHPGISATASIASAGAIPLHFHAPASVTISLPQKQHNLQLFKPSPSQPLDCSVPPNPVSGLCPGSAQHPSPLAISSSSAAGSSTSLNQPHQQQQPASGIQTITLAHPPQQPPDLTLVGGLECRAPLFVDAVEADSPAWQAGLKRGDRLLEVNGTRLDPLHLPLPRVLAMLGCSSTGGPPGGQRVELVVMSDRCAYFELKARLKKPAKASLSSDLVVSSSTGSGDKLDAPDDGAAAASLASSEKRNEPDSIPGLSKMAALIPAQERCGSLSYIPVQK